MSKVRVHPPCITLYADVYQIEDNTDGKKITENNFFRDIPISAVIELCNPVSGNRMHKHSFLSKYHLV